MSVRCGAICLIALFVALSGQGSNQETGASKQLAPPLPCTHLLIALKWNCGGEMNDSILRQNLVESLRGGHAHVTPKQALNGLEPALRNVRPANSPHSVWEKLEHMRLAQEDILRYTLDASWVSPEFPEGYWPKKTGE